MQLTSEQIAIIHSAGDIKINAVAGSGKTTTIIEYAKSRPANSRILYLAFNKSVKLEAVKKFTEKGLSNVRVETAHSLAFTDIVLRSHYKVKNQGYKINELVEILNLKGNGEKHTEYVIANHINKLVSYFCNSDKQRVSELNYLDTITDPKAKSFATKCYDYILHHTRVLLSKMDKAEIEIPHDFYLKKFQLANIKLPYDYILFDEGQDASAAMLDVFFKQDATKVIVGDTHQQIYGWRYAVNSLEKAPFKTYYLSSSFRFTQPIANLAMNVLNLKLIMHDFEAIDIVGKGKNKAIKTKAIIARTNLGLLLKAIEYVTEKKYINKIYFEGNINSYTYAEDGASLYDVLNLYNQNKQLIKDKLIHSMSDLNELNDYIEKTEDVQLSMMVEIVKEYGNRIPGIINKIKEKHIGNEEREKADMIFSTVHRAKGMEYDVVHLVDDFITEDQLKKIKEAEKPNDINLTRLNEEINLLYVAVTRTKNQLHIPHAMLPSDVALSTEIKVIEPPVKDKNKKDNKSKFQRENKEKSYTVEAVRTKHTDAYKP
ncbi:MAG: ATP-dependent helicase, partial [Chitinophagaceae bacterium]|nr:ATP-dependent helicase [Chitinophagaceae bacterium]